MLFLGYKTIIGLSIINTFDDLNHNYLPLLNDLLPAIMGTILVTLFSVIIATPLGILSGIYINEYIRCVKKRELASFLFKLLAGTPSIVVGVFGFVIVLTINSIFNLSLKTSLLVAGFSLALLLTPYIVHSTILALQEVPQNIRIAALSLGGKKYQSIFRILLPHSFLKLASGVILAIGRAAEDTAVIMLTGVAAFSGIPSNLSDNFEALPYYIYYHSAEYQNQAELSRVFIAALCIVIISSSFIIISGFFNKKLSRYLTR